MPGLQTTPQFSAHAAKHWLSDHQQRCYTFRKKQNPMTSVETMFVSKGLLHTQEIITGGLSGGNPAGRGKQVREMTSDKTTVAADLPTQVCFAV